MNVKAHSNDATLAGFRLLNSNANLYITRDKILFSDIVLKTNDDIHATGEGELNLDELTNYNFNLETKKLSFAKLSEVLNFELDVLKTDLSTNYLTLVGTGSPLDMTVNGNITAKNIDFAKINEFSDKNLPTCQSDFTIKIKPTKIIFPQDILSVQITLYGDLKAHFRWKHLY